jgi:hypothetical protein
LNHTRRICMTHRYSNPVAFREDDRHTPTYLYTPVYLML